MAKFIKTIVDRINMATKKGLCPYYSPDQLEDEVHAESMNLWKKYIDDFEKTQKMSVYMDPFRLKEVVAISSGSGTLVTAKGQYRISVFVTGTDIKIDMVNIDKWADRINNSVVGPDATYPVGRIDNAAIYIRPTSVTSVDVHFLKTPKKPVYAFTPSDDDYVYNDGSSEDFEWPEILHDEIMNRVLANLGIAQREGELIQYSNLEQQKEGK